MHVNKEMKKKYINWWGRGFVLFLLKGWLKFSMS